MTSLLSVAGTAVKSLSAVTFLRWERVTDAMFGRYFLFWNSASPFYSEVTVASKWKKWYCDPNASMQYSSSETCSLNLVGLSLSHHGCQPKVVTATACRGTCHSRAVPEWRYEDQAVRLVNYCTCCEPMRSLKRSVTLTCPNTSRGFRVFPVAIPVQCACRPCSDGNPEAEQPYDY